MASRVQQQGCLAFAVAARRSRLERYQLGLALLGLVAGCSEGNSPPPLPDGSQQGLDATGDVLPRFELSAPPADQRVDASACVLGTVAHCTACGDVCPPGQDSASTQRTCDVDGCSIRCDNESYDVNGELGDGCEVEDDLPLHANALEARDLGSVSDCGQPVRSEGRLPSDDRLHLVAPAERTNGREDWYALNIEDALCVVQAEVTVQLTSLPASGNYQASASYVCQNGQAQPEVTGTAAGGQSIVLQPPVHCTLLVGNDSGRLLVKVAKLSGPHSSGGYSVEMVP